MQQRQLGKNGPKVSAMGLGAMAMTPLYGPVDQDEAVATIHEALDRGMDLIDTSDAYGAGTNEELIGRAIKGRRDKAFIASKFGNLGANGANGKPDYVVEACDKSLQRLDVDAIDLYFQHRVDPDTPIEDTIGAMTRLVEQGKVRYLGLSEAAPETIRRASAVHPICAVQTEYSLWCRFVEDDVLPTCRDLGIAFMPYSPLGRGMLTGAIQGDASLGENDRRRDHPRFQGENLDHNIELIRPLLDMAEQKGCTPSQLAIAWLLAQGDDIFPIPGTKRRTHLVENIEAADLQISADEATTLAAQLHYADVAGTRYPGKQMEMVNL